MTRYARLVLWSSLLILLQTLLGCAIAPKDKTVQGYFFYQGQEDERVPVDIPIIQEGSTTRLKFIKERIAYRNNRKAAVAFVLPSSLLTNVHQIELDLEAYNDDAKYARAIWLQVDAVGGYLGTRGVQPGQTNGPFTLGKKQKGHWILDLDSISVTANNNAGSKNVSFFDALSRPGLHVIGCWISTYEQYGPDSWVSLDLLLKH